MVDYRLNPTLDHLLVRPVHPSSGASGKPAGGGGGVIAVNFDGSNDYLDSTGMTGAVDSKLLTFSCWVNFADLTTDHIFYSNNHLVSGFTVFKATSKKLTIQGWDTSGTGILNALATTEFSTGIWYNILVSVDMADTGKRHVYINDVAETMTWSTYTDGILDFTTVWAVGARHVGTVKMDGDMSELWFEDGLYTDFSIESNRLKFINASDKPEDLGADGSIPFGSPPLIYLTSAVDSWHLNKGSGSDYTENGALTEASSSPSD